MRGRVTGWLLLMLVCMVASTARSAEDVRYVVRCDPGEDLVRGSRIEVSSATGAPGAKYSYEDMVDHDLSTNWATAHSAALPQWVKVTFPAARTVDTVVLITRGASTIYSDWKGVTIEFSSGNPVTVSLEERAGAHILRIGPRTVGWMKVIVTEDWGRKAYHGLHALLAFSDPEQKIQREIPLEERWRGVSLAETGRDVHPCVYITPEDVARARTNIDTHAWARDHAEALVRLADTVVDKSPAWIREHCPDQDAAFAYGFTGCPICSARWGTWGGADCSFDRPGTVECRNGHILPNATYRDPGTGYVGGDGRIHYFVASYNAWVVETYQKWCQWLSFAYTVTGEDKYAVTCAVVLDALAEIYPSCDEGSWDYPSNPPSGRLNRPWYQVARVLVLLVDYYDRIYNTPALEAASFVPGLTRRQSIEKRMLKNGAWYCYEQSLKGGMHNGEADYIRGALSVGCLLGIEAYVDWAVDGPYGIHAMIYNNADRDGGYVETSLSYSSHARDLYLTFAEPLSNYRSASRPEGLNLYDDITFRSLYILPNLTTDAVGHSPRIGDSAPDTREAYPDAKHFDEKDYVYAERIHARASDPQVKADFGALVTYFADGDIEALRGISADREWRLFHCEDEPAGKGVLPPDLEARISESVLMGQRGVAILRTPTGEMAQACLMRYGPVLNHGHLDDLNINYFALGLELTYDLGYGLGSTHTQRGWARQTSSHQLVLVNEKSQQPTPLVDDSGGSLHLFGGMPGLQLVDADANNVYRSLGVNTYRRFLALVGDGPQSYLVDIFKVEGGSQHDYLAHALSDNVLFRGIAFGRRADGSVAGPEYEWGTLQLNDGDMEGYPNKPYWSPPPDNGLGFLMHPRTATSTGPWSATWGLPGSGRYLRMTVLSEPGTEVINAWAPGIYPSYPKAEHVIVRRRMGTGKLKSTFVTVREPYGPAPGSGETSALPNITRVERLAASDGATALAIHLEGGAVDQLVYAGTPVQAATGGSVEVEGCLGYVREGAGSALKAILVGKSIVTPTFKLELPRGAYEGSIVRVDYRENLVTVDADLPADGRLNSGTIQFQNPAYSRNTTYTIHEVYRDEDGLCVIDLGPQRTILGQGTLHMDPISGTEMSSLTPHEYANGQTRTGVDFFDGKVLVSEDWSQETRIRSMTSSPQSAELVVASTEGFSAGDTFYYLDIAPGDAMLVCNWASMERDADGEIRVAATDDVTLKIDGKTHYYLWSRGGGVGDLGDPDFDGSGSVDFADFIMFARAFGATAADPDFEARFDLNEDNAVNFADFVLFAGVFGERGAA
jgi:hypothetical protein